MNMLAAHLAPTARSITSYFTNRRAPEKRAGWDIEREVVRGRRLDFGRKFLPDGLSRLHSLPFLTPPEHLFLSQVQGRSYANFFALSERFISGKLLEIGMDDGIADVDSREAMVRIVEEERKHEELFRRLEAMIGAGMPSGYTFVLRPHDVACTVLGRSDWAMLGVTLDIEVMTQAHYRTSIAQDATLDALWKDVFLFHSIEESQHATIDEALWRRADAGLTSAERDDAVTDFLDLVAALDDILHAQAQADAAFFLSRTRRVISTGHARAIQETLLKAYRWQHIVIGVLEKCFVEVLKALVTPAQMLRVEAALAPILASVVARLQAA